MNITFLITNYNYGSYLPRLFESLKKLNPIYDGTSKIGYNLLIGDDCSTDGSQSIIKQLCQDYAHLFGETKIVLSAENKGKNYLLNQLMPLIKTPFTVIIDADDWLHPDFLVKCWETHLNNQHKENIGFYYSNCILCDNDARQVGLGKSTDFCPELIKTYSYIPQTCLIKTQALMTSFPLDESIRVGTKHHQWNKICAAGWRGVHIPADLFYYRMHAANISNIGQKVLSEDHNSLKDRLLYGYWPTAQAQRSETKASTL